MAALRQVCAVDALEDSGLTRTRTAGNTYELSGQHAQRNVLAAAHATIGSMQGKALGKIIDCKKRARFGLKKFAHVAHYLSSHPSVSAAVAGT